MKRLRRTGPALLRTCALAGALTSFPCPGSLARAEQVVENHGDGSPKVRYGTDAEGRRDGPYEELFPDGTPKVKGTYLAGEKHGNWTTRNESGKVVESATYRNGVLHGPYTAGFPSGKPRLKAKYKAGAPAGTVTVLDEKGKTERVVTYPRARDEVEKAWAKLYVKHPAPPAFTEEPSLDPPHRAGRLSPETVDEALRTVQLYRYLSGLTWQDMKADPALCARAQHGAVLLAELGHLTHTPPRPADMDEAFFKVAYAGCSQSNLHQGQGSVVDGIHGFMDDSDSGNIGTVGHRQWLLCPGLQRVGFGTAGRFVAVHVLEANRAVRTPRGFAAFPGDGYFPRELLQPHYAWSVHFDRSNVKPDRGKVRVELKRLDDLYAAVEDVPVRVVGVAEGAHNSVALIFKPDLKSVEAARYWVSVDGLSDPRGRPAPPLGYVVELIDMAGVAPAAGGATSPGAAAPPARPAKREGSAAPARTSKPTPGPARRP